jgi:hypothetical protein
VHTALKLDQQHLTYLIFDGLSLVAAFAMRDDAEGWIDVCGNQQMTLRKSSWCPQLKRARGRRKDKAAKTATTQISRKR